MPDTPTSSSSPWTGRVVGGIQVIGGALEIALGAGGVAAPTGVTQVGGVILIAHGADTVVAGFRSMWYGAPQSTLTQRGATAAAQSLGASEQTARYIGTGTDLVAGVGPSIAVGVSRRLAIAGAERATERVAVAYLHRGALEMGHNAIGIRQGGTTAWVHFAGVPTGAVVPTAAPNTARYVVTELAVSAQAAARGAQAQRSLVAAGQQTWGYLGPNCTTTALKVLQEAGIVVPAWSRTPFLLHLGVNAGAEITIVGGTAAAVAGAQRPPPQPPRGRPGA
jgi:hypothetical protein